MGPNHLERRFSVEGSAGGTGASSDVQSYTVTAKTLAKVAEVEVMAHGFHE